MYTYKAICVKVYDGDTITVDIDLGFGVWAKKQKVRLFGIDTPEVRGENKTYGFYVRDFLKEKILDKEIVIRTEKDKKGKYGRWLGTVYLEDENINELLVQKGYAQLLLY